MNQPTTYEQLIAQKLQELAVPDQANAIWTTIEHQLNIEMPVDGSGSGGSNNFNWWIGGGSLFTFIIAVITYISISKQNLESERDLKDKPTTIQHQQPAKSREDTLSHALFPIETNGNKPEAVSPTNKLTKEATAPATKDTVISAAASKPAGLPAVQPPSADTIVTRKKPRGVKGISDADYRLVPSEKDSTRRKN